jgi:DNA-binding HxlR family transcriptional regulator
VETSEIFKEFGNKYTLDILQSIKFCRKRRVNLTKEMDTSTELMHRRINFLLENKYINKEKDDERKVYYSLREKGINLLELAKELKSLHEGV